LRVTITDGTRSQYLRKRQHRIATCHLHGSALKRIYREHPPDERSPATSHHKPNQVLPSCLVLYTPDERSPATSHHKLNQVLPSCLVLYTVYLLTGPLMCVPRGSPLENFNRQGRGDVAPDRIMLSKMLFL
jgi:hypothetical protein